MSLLDDYREQCCIMVKTRTADGSGGYTNSWAQGTAFKASIALASKQRQVSGEHEGEARDYTIITDRSVSLPLNAVIKRKGNRYLRIIASNVDQQAPESSKLAISWATGEECVLQ